MYMIIYLCSWHCTSYICQTIVKIWQSHWKLVLSWFQVIILEIIWHWNQDSGKKALDMVLSAFKFHYFTYCFLTVSSLWKHCSKFTVVFYLLCRGANVLKEPVTSRESTAKQELFIRRSSCTLFGWCICRIVCETTYLDRGMKSACRGNHVELMSQRLRTELDPRRCVSWKF